jgi:hypothetical protein
VITTQTSVFQLMTTATLRKIETEDPEVALVLHKFLARLLCNHLLRSTAIVDNLSK